MTVGPHRLRVWEAALPRTGSPAQFRVRHGIFCRARDDRAAHPITRIESINALLRSAASRDRQERHPLAANECRASLESTMRRLIAAAGSSGASIAAFAAYNTDFEPEDEDRHLTRTQRPGALLNPAFGCPPPSNLTGRAPAL